MRDYNRAKVGQLLRDGKSVVRSSFLRGLPRDPQKREQALQNVYVIPHTHWDREWWKTFEGYREILVPLIYGLMDLLEQNPDFVSFTFDGQVAPIDDFLDTLSGAERTKAEQRLSVLIAAGRLQIGPEYTLSDQFLVSGETTLRNYEWGMKRALELGKLMDIAYCPDQFGLIQELPKILNYVGITKVIGERGMKREFPGKFRWVTADGSSVDVVNLKDGYFHKQLKARNLRNIARKNHGDVALFLAGYDHAIPTAEIVEAARKAGVRLSTLPQFWEAQQTHEVLDVEHGEIRSAGDKNLLPNVISNRVDQRLEVIQAEQALERYAEPLAALVLGTYPTRQLSDAWKLQLWNSAHDSACATGIDEVTTAVRGRAARVKELADAISHDALGELAQRLHDPGSYVWNPSNFTRDCWVTINGVDRVVRDVPGLGWSKVDEQCDPPSLTIPTIPSYHFVDQGDHGDTYTFSPAGKEREIPLPTTVTKRDGEAFSRMNIAWTNAQENHRVRIVLKLPVPVTGTIADTSFGHVERPAVPELLQGRDRLNGYPAGKFIIAGGLAILVDRMAEYELLPETNELAITLVRAHGALSVVNPKYRLWSAGPRLATHDTQMIQPLEWNLGILPWSSTTDLPWKEWEAFALEGKTFESAGGGSLAESGTLCAQVPSGVLSAVLPDGIRTFEANGAHRIGMHPLVRALPAAQILMKHVRGVT